MLKRIVLVVCQDNASVVASKGGRGIIGRIGSRIKK